MRKLAASTTALGAAAVLLAAVSGFLGFKYASLSNSMREAEIRHASSTDVLKTKILELEGTLALEEDENDELLAKLEREQEKNEAIEEQVQGIAKTVGKLEKLSQTDKELLQKYSKVYFLNEHYVPENLTDIDSKFLYDGDRTLQIHSKVEPFLTDMIEKAAEDGIELRIVSAYRSFGTQAALKSNYTVTYGSGANKFSADQGYSEHQLGTTLDFTTEELGAAFTSFDKTKAYEWLTENAEDFGFILSYPQNNAYYQFEPWHWRFVGDRLARRLKRDGVSFYDMDQREIDEYLVTIFD